MNLDLRNKEEVLSQVPSIETKISHVMSEIDKEFKFKGNALEDLMTFKFKKQKESTIENSVEYKNALIDEIKNKANSGDITAQDSAETLTQAKYEVLATKIIEINKLTNEIQGEIQKLRAEFLRDSLAEVSLGSDDFITKKWYSKAFLNRLEHPQNTQDEMLGFAVSSLESIAMIGKFGYDVVKGVVLSPYHLVQIITGKAKYDGVEI